ncbi:uncharacterized protein LOC132629065 [Lycium barbarum]|uniref:uncharacterized protein LOC132629065 n=1 Tax=Lycium barbarum TaxID=112863 RepID=UPI00293F69DF|nr:uncharacterized protein LOC132629065 [Lycium barbarum]
MTSTDWVNEPWVVLGDFNNVLLVQDRINGQPVHIHETTDFQNCIKDIGLGQLTRRGYQYSWSNKKDAESRVYSLIDWIFGNDLWFLKYSSLTAHYLVPESSDHSPILVRTEVDRYNLPRPFRLYNTLIQQQPFQELVHTTWEKSINGHTMYKVWKKLKLIEKGAAQMNREMNSIDRKVEELQELLTNAQMQLNMDLFNPQLIEIEIQAFTQLQK